MTNDLEAIAALIKASTPGPWCSQQHEQTEQRNAGFFIMTDDHLLGSVISYKGMTGGYPRSIDDAANDANFIAASRTLIPALVAEVRELRKQVAALRKGQTALSAYNEPPVGTWVRDRFGATSYRQEHGWGQPGMMPFGKWEAMWEARGPYVICGPWGNDV